SEDHQCVAIFDSEPTGGVVRRLDSKELRPGHRIIMREAGERDVIPAIAERTRGLSSYATLRHRSDLWLRVRTSSRFSDEDIAGRLERIGVKRNLATIRAWINNPEIFGPRQLSDIEGIADVFGDDTIGDEQWQQCIDAVRELRSLHVSAG